MSHIALVIPGLDRIGGAEKQVLLLAGGLAQRGWRVTVIALSGQGRDAARELSASGVDFVSLGMRKGLADPRGWIRFRNWLVREHPEVVHAHLPHAAWLARWTRLAAPVRVVLDTLHSSFTGGLGRRLGYRASDWLTDRVTAVSQAVADSHRALHFTGPRKLTVLPNGIDLKAHAPNLGERAAVRREMGIEEVFLWIAAGRLEPVKDYPSLLCALANMPGKPHLLIAGEGSLGKELRRLTAVLDLQNQVHFLGFCPDIRRWMQAADAFVLCSRWEGLPLSALEAAAACLPCVATDVPGTNEVIVDGWTGFLAPAGSPAALEAAMTRMMLLPPAERISMGLEARRFVEHDFCLESVLDRWEALYTELLAQNPAPVRRSVGISS